MVCAPGAGRTGCQAILDVGRAFQHCADAQGRRQSMLRVLTEASWQETNKMARPAALRPIGPCLHRCRNDRSLLRRPLAALRASLSHAVRQRQGSAAAPLRRL